MLSGELAKPGDERRIRLIRLLNEEGRVLLRDWAQRDDKVRY